MIQGEKKPEDLIELERLVRKNPGNPDLRICLGANYSILGFDKLAESQYRVALLLNPELGCAYDAMIDILKIKSKKPEFERNAIGQMAVVMAMGENNGAYSGDMKKFLL